MNDHGLTPDFSDMTSECPIIQYSAKDTLFAWLSIAIGFLLALAMPSSDHPLGMVIILTMLFAFGIAYSRVNSLPIRKSSHLLMVAAIVMSLGLLTGTNKAIHRFLVFFLLCVFLYWVYASRGLAGRFFQESSIRHIIESVVFLPASSIRFFFPALVLKDKSTAANKIMKTVLWALAGLGCAVIPTIVVILLLSYDKSFTALIDSMITFSPDSIIDLIGDLMIGFIASMLIFGSLYGTGHRLMQNGGQPQSPREFNYHCLPRPLVCATVTPVLAVYVLFFISQWNYYVSAFTGVLPSDLTYAEYARSGFFQLCWVCAINAVMLFFFNILIKKNEKPRDLIKNIYSTVISLFTLILIATALSKMFLYIESYGLTQKRVYTSWFMLLLAAIFIIVIIGQFVRKIPKASVIAVTVVIFVALIALPNVDGMIASYNVNAYKSGELSTVDVGAICKLDVSGVPALVELRRELISRDFLSEDDKVKLDKIDDHLRALHYRLNELPTGIFDFNIPTARARALINEIYGQ